MQDDKMIEIKKVSYQDCCGSGPGDSHYPWGTRITLENETLAALKVDSLAPGDVVEVKAYATVESVSQDADKTKSHRAMTMQITKISVERETEKVDLASQLYP